VSVRVEGVEQVNELIKSLSLMPTDAVNWIKLASKAKEIVSKRTASGRDVSGDKFSPYSASYLEYKEERLDRPVTRVDLFDTGNMLGAMQVDGTKVGSRVFFADPDEGKQARKHNEGDGLPKREIFAMSDDEIDSQIMPNVNKDIDKFMEGL